MMARLARLVAVSSAAALWLSPAAAAEAPVLRQVRVHGQRTPAQPSDVNGFLITSPQGVKVLVDVSNITPEVAPELENPRNLLLATHGHLDHLNEHARAVFKGKTLIADHIGLAEERGPFPTVGAVSSGDVRVEAVRAAHFANDLDHSTDIILIIDVAGVRFVHLGDCGQDELTPEQLRRIGRVDVMMQVLEDIDDDGKVDRRALNLLAQVAPTIVIPTHVFTTDGLKLLDGTHPAEIAGADELAVTPALLAHGKRAIIMGANRALAAAAGIRKSPGL